MDNLMMGDLIFLGLFLIFIVSFLIRNKSKIKKEGLLFLYHTTWGINLINKIGTKNKKLIQKAAYLSVFTGYILMGIMLFMFLKIVWIYVFQGNLVSAIKLPPIAPLIPYLPQIFQLNWLPPFYFSYWIIILLIIAITHELFHGIFARAYDVKTNTTGFGFFPFFLPIFLAAFVNLDEKMMQKKSSFKQRAVLSAGTFANLLTTILGLLLLWGFFSIAYSPAGITYDDYAYKIVNITDIDKINGMEINWEKENLSKFENLTITSLEVNDEKFYTLKAISKEDNLAALYYSSPAIKNQISGAITKINGEKIDSLDKLSKELLKYSPGETIELTLYNGSSYKKNLTLENNPSDPLKPWLGISFSTPKGALSSITSFFTAYKQPNVYYVSSSEFSTYIYNLLWWLVFISFSVALVNMIPMGIFDGGRFFYLTILSITKSKKIAEVSFKVVTQILLFLVFVMMFFWAKNLF